MDYAALATTAVTGAVTGGTSFFASGINVSDILNNCITQAYIAYPPLSGQGAARSAFIAQCNDQAPRTYINQGMDLTTLLLIGGGVLLIAKLAK